MLTRDFEEIKIGLTAEEKEKLAGSRLLITGFAGSLGFMLTQFLKEYAKELSISKVYCLDNFIFGKPDWVSSLDNNPLFSIQQGNITNCNLSFAKDANYILHMASLASPVYYRLHPIETMDADVIGIRRLLEYYADKDIKNLLFFSTSEIYGNPPVNMLPTPESYWGNVNPAGPRACYDESKRFGETLCYYFNKQRGVPVTVIRPFNSFGPGLRMNDQRVAADFACNVLSGQDIAIYSDGMATRTFCYITDTVTGILKCMLYVKYDTFNIGQEGPELTVLQFAQLFQKLGRKYFDYQGEIRFKTHQDTHYLTDNPQRRCPDLTKSREVLRFTPRVAVEDGIMRYLLYLKGGN